MYYSLSLRLLPNAKTRLAHALNNRAFDAFFFSLPHERPLPETSSKWCARGSPQCRVSKCRSQTAHFEQDLVQRSLHYIIPTLSISSFRSWACLSLSLSLSMALASSRLPHSLLHGALQMSAAKETTSHRNSLCFDKQKVALFLPIAFLLTSSLSLSLPLSQSLSCRNFRCKLPLGDRRRIQLQNRAEKELKKTRVAIKLI